MTTRRPPGERVLERVQVGLCWDFAHAVNGDGYGTVWDSAARHATKAYIAVWEHLVGPVPRLANGRRTPLDHLCRNRLCVDPDHLEPVSIRVNTLRGYGPTAMKARAARLALAMDAGQLHVPGLVVIQ